jgi:hypothetical protein
LSPGGRAFADAEHLFVLPGLAAFPHLKQLHCYGE